MKLKKFLAAALALCLLLSMVPMMAHAEEIIETIEPGEVKRIEKTAEVSATYTFVPEKDGTYILSSMAMCDSYTWFPNIDIHGPEGQLFWAESLVQLEAKAGESYTIVVFWGPWEEETNYIEVSLQEPVAAESIWFDGIIGDEVVLYLDKDSESTRTCYVRGNPQNALVEGVVFSSSNEKIAKIIATGENFCEFKPLAVGKTTITAKMGDLTTSFELEVKEKKKLELGKEETLVATETETYYSEEYLFTAKEAGTYVFYGLDVNFDAYGESIVENVNSYQRLQLDMKAGETINVSAGFWYGEGSYSNTRSFMVQKGCPAQSIDIFDDTLVLWAGDEYSNYNYLEVAAQPEFGILSNVVWSSSNEKVATVDEYGKVTAVAAGTCTVTATMGNLSASVKVYVRAFRNMELNKKETLTGVESIARGYFQVPADGTYVIWGEGLVFEAMSEETYALGVERAQFTAKKGDIIEMYISTMYDEENATYSFVIEKSVDAKSFEIRSVEGDGADDFVGIGRTKIVYLKMNPANGDYFDLAWKSNDESVLVLEQISDGLCVIYGVKPGQASISATIGDQTVTKTFTVDYYQPFGDVAVNKYYYAPVLWAVDMGITGGYKDGTFRPDKTCTRAEVVTFLWRAAGEPKPETTQNPFADVATDKYYYDSVLWALENEITSGYKDGTFQPSKTCSRAEVVTFLWRAAGSPKPTKTDNPFEDVAADKYYYDAVLWAVEMGITTGKTATTFQPSATCTRAQIVTFLYRFLVGE